MSPNISQAEPILPRHLATFSAFFRILLEGTCSHWQVAERFYARNQRVVDDCDRIIAFVALDRLGGTEDTIRRAWKAGKSVEVR
jgi:hypothetical protein